MERDEALGRARLRWEEVDRLKSTEHTKKIIANFKKSQEYKAEVEAWAVSFLDKGVIHAIHQLHPFVPDKMLLVETFENNYEAKACRKWADFVPFQEDELEALWAIDQERGFPEWVPPPVLHPSFWELLETPEGIPSAKVSGLVVPNETSTDPTLSVVHSDPLLANPTPKR